MLVDIEKINEAKEKLGDRNAQIIAETFGVENGTKETIKDCVHFTSKILQVLYITRRFTSADALDVAKL